MRQSKLFTKTLKETPKDEVSINAQLLIRAGFIDKLFAGVYNILPLGLQVIKKIEQIIREELAKVDGQEVLMPALHPLENYEKTGREKIDVLFYTEMHDGKKLVLGQSHEEIVTPLVQKYVRSYKDLPQAVYQFQNKFRNELRAKSGIMRGREFRMKDMYSFHIDEEDLEKYYERVEKVYEQIFKRLGLGDITVKTFASGGTFSKYSHEYQTFTDSGEDVIYLCTNCNIAVNKEIIAELEGKCPECDSDILEEKKAIEVGNIFKLGTRFSEAFNFSYTNKEGKEQPIQMGCYGIGITRLLGTIAEINHDDKGIIWPESVAPFQVHLISLCKTEEEKQQAEDLYKTMLDKGIEVLYDDRDISAGEKFSDSDLLGIPKRVVVSPKTLDQGSIEVKERTSSDSKLVEIKKIDSVL